MNERPLICSPNPIEVLMFMQRGRKREDGMRRKVAGSGSATAMGKQEVEKDKDKVE